MEVLKDAPKKRVYQKNNNKVKKTLDVIKWIEEHYPQMSSDFKRIQEEQYELFCSKQYDYGSSNITLGGDIDKPEDLKLALTGLTVRINDKVNRLINLVIKKGCEAQNEPVMDTFKDLSVYGIIAQIVKNGTWGK